MVERKLDNKISVDLDMITCLCLGAIGNMTTPAQRTRAIKDAEIFLLRLADSFRTPKIPSEIRREALAVLRHYPSDYHMVKAIEKAPDVFGDYYDRAP